MNSDEGTKKGEERRHVELAVKLRGWDAKVVDGERPDFHLVFQGGRRVGLEHTRAVDQFIANGRGPVRKFEETLSQCESLSLSVAR